jgi:hypothetical protein
MLWKRVTSFATRHSALLSYVFKGLFIGFLWGG